MKKLLGIATALGLSTAIMAGSAHAGKLKKDIIDTAESAGSFSTLVAAIEAADLDDTLKGDGPFTVFAPSDDAFAALPEGQVEELLLPENKDMLVELLSYHVVPGKILSEDITEDTGTVENLAGSALDVDVSDGVVIKTATVTEADIEAANGVIHVVDEVILPTSWPAS